VKRIAAGTLLEDEKPDKRGLCLFAVKYCELG
jgi:hypothetical protein